MSISGSQRGFLRRAGSNEKGISAAIEYQSPDSPYIPFESGRGGVEIINVKSLDGQNIEDGDYEFTVIEAGFLPVRGRIIVRNDGGRWCQLDS